MAVYSVRLEDVMEDEAPPNEVMDIRRIGDVVFFTVSEFDESATESKTTTLSEFGVNVDDLVRGLAAMNIWCTIYDEDSMDVR